jgi:chondroitin AC lyase
MGMTGQNKVWLAGIALMMGVLTDDRDLVAKARGQIFEELRITTAEGVQPDYSFHQHGPQQQWGNYGASFGGDMIKWASIFRGTGYAPDADQIAILGRYLSEGSAWTLWRGRMDISGCGRQIFRGCQSGKGNGILGQLELMTKVDPDRAGTYRDILASHRPGGNNTLIGHRHFWRSDITIHRRPAWYASVRMSSTRVIGAETCNGENMMGLHLGDGVTYFHRTGTEYEDLFPVWDWRRLPGTTCLQNDQSLVPGSRRCRGKSDFVGGVSDGSEGVAAMEYIRGSLHARKAWFFLDNAVVCLGAGIDCDDPEAVLTSVNQCVLNGPVTVSAGRQARELSKGECFTDRLEWVHHDGIGYVFLEPRKATAGAVTQSGNWHAIHRRESTTTVERDVFNLWIDHGPRPTEARYAYVVLPDVTVGDVRSFYKSRPVTVLAQTPSLHAVMRRDGRKVQAVFFEPGRLAWGSGQSIEVDMPCLAALDRTAKLVRVHVADPTHRRETIRLRLSGKYTGPGVRYERQTEQSELIIDLPQGGSAGQTVSVELRR